MTDVRGVNGGFEVPPGLSNVVVLRESGSTQDWLNGGGTGVNRARFKRGDTGTPAVLPFTPTSPSRGTFNFPLNKAGLPITGPISPQEIELFYEAPTPPVVTPGNGIFGNSGVRFVPHIGTRIPGAVRNLDLQIIPNYMQIEWNRHMAPAMQTVPTAWTGGVDPSITIKVKMPAFLMDESLAPVSRAQAQDPAWTNYRWNHRDHLAELVADLAVIEPRAKLHVLVADSATADHRCIPSAAIQAGLTWREAGFGDFRDRWKMWIPEAEHWLTDFYIAFLRHHGQESSGIAGIITGEYYRGSNRSEFPPDMFGNENAYYQGRLNMMTNAGAQRPIAADGSKVYFSQVNIIASGPVSYADFRDAGLGYSASDTILFRKADEVLAFDGLQPAGMQGDSFFSRQERFQQWKDDATKYLDDPFGREHNSWAIATPPELMWHAAQFGPAPLDFLTMKLESDARYTQTYANFIQGLQMFARGGTLASTYGQMPMVRS